MRASGLLHSSVLQLNDVESAILNKPTGEDASGNPTVNSAVSGDVSAGVPVSQVLDGELKTANHKRFWLVARRLLPGQINQLGNDIDSNLYEVYQVLEKHPMMIGDSNVEQTLGNSNSHEITARRKEKKSDAIRRLDFADIRRKYAAVLDAPVPNSIGTNGARKLDGAFPYERHLELLDSGSLQGAELSYEKMDAMPVFTHVLAQPGQPGAVQPAVSGGPPLGKRQKTLRIVGEHGQKTSRIGGEHGCADGVDSDSASGSPNASPSGTGASSMLGKDILHANEDRSISNLGKPGTIVGVDWRNDQIQTGTPASDVGVVVVIKKFLYPAISFKAAEDLVKSLKAFNPSVPLSGATGQVPQSGVAGALKINGLESLQDQRAGPTSGNDVSFDTFAVAQMCKSENKDPKLYINGSTPMNGASQNGGRSPFGFRAANYRDQLVDHVHHQRVMAKNGPNHRDAFPGATGRTTATGGGGGGSFEGAWGGSNSKNGNGYAHGGKNGSGAAGNGGKGNGGTGKGGNGGGGKGGAGKGMDRADAQAHAYAATHSKGGKGGANTTPRIEITPQGMVRGNPNPQQQQFLPIESQHGHAHGRPDSHSHSHSYVRDYTVSGQVPVYTPSTTYSGEGHTHSMGTGNMSNGYQQHQLQQTQPVAPETARGNGYGNGGYGAPYGRNANGQVTPRSQTQTQGHGNGAYGNGHGGAWGGNGGYGGGYAHTAYGGHANGYGAHAYK